MVTIMSVTVSMFCSHVEPIVGARGERLVELATLMEQAGADQIVFSEHVVLGPDLEMHGGAPFPFPVDHNYPEPLIALAAIAGATRRLRLSTGILIAPMRPAVLLAKMAATLDVVSGGRFDLGLGAGWHAAELRAAGNDPAHAMQTLEDTLGACRALWGGGPASFRSPSVSFDGLYCYPRPASGAALPVWLAGPCARSTFRRIARLGNGWVPFGNVTADAIARGSAMLDEAAAAEGRDRASFGIRASLPIGTGSPRERLDYALAAAPEFIAAGATALQLPLFRLADDFDTAFELTSIAVQAIHSL
jgi:probable F420-dependent oxidoreductase